MTGIAMIDLDTTQSDPSRSNHSSPSARPPTRDLLDKGLRAQIEALIPRLRRYARAMVHDPVAADDLVQDCLVRAIEKIHLWERGTDLRAWLFTILHNQHISRTRQAARQREVIELQKCKPGLALLPGQMGRLELRDLERAIARLPEEQRSLILLVGLEGMQYDEVASVVNLPVGTVRSRVSRGRETLRMMTGLFPGRHSRRPGIAARPGAGNQLQPRSPQLLQ